MQSTRNYEIWEAFNNQYWPAQYLIDAKGRIRHRHFGEGEYGELERAIQERLRESGVTRLDTNLVALMVKKVVRRAEVKGHRHGFRVSGVLLIEGR